MNMELKQKMEMAIGAFHMPRYHQLPNMGLYLEQVTTYLTDVLAPLGCIEITGSMIRNYVKKGLVANPVQKRYYADQIAHLIAVFVLKAVLPLEHIQTLFSRQERIYETPLAYDYLCMELENMLQYQFGLKDSVDEIGTTHSTEKQMLRSAVIAVTNMIYLDSCFRLLAKDDKL